MSHLIVRGPNDHAAAAQGVEARELAAGFDSLSLCLSKGLGAPVGTVLLGRREFIDQARRPRKMLGGAMRQSGILAAAALYALEHHVARLADDHANAQRLARGLGEIAELQVDGPHTNMLFVALDPERCAAFARHLAAAGIAALVRPRTRLVTHLDVDPAAIERVIVVVKDFFARR